MPIGQSTETEIIARSQARQFFAPAIITNFVRSAVYYDNDRYAYVISAVQ